MIRDATRDDLGVVAELIRSLAEYEHLADEVVWDEADLAATLFGPDAVPSTLLAVADDGAVAGMAIWYRTYSTFEGRPGIWLEDLFVRPEHRGAGHGRALLEALFDQAGAGRVEWSVLDWNEPSIRFYESLGARPVDGWLRYRWQRTPT
ncbi:MAG: GNAT family N-acetyltransferase [Actinomycetota bacterium]|nr:GNAT family N-acetyltransferase [Acidimicrobiia bacterium]MDQ3293058.1 GNAT family N-acetyltransferase [Actinomycetota bacterium]